MKKILVVLIVALVVVASASAFAFKSVGVTIGSVSSVGAEFVVVDMEIVDNLDVYAGIGYAGDFAITSGIQYKVGSFELGGTYVAIRPGAQVNTYIYSGTASFGVLGTCAFSFDARSLTGFLRPGLGIGLAIYKDGESGTTIHSEFGFSLEAGVAYLF